MEETLHNRVIGQEEAVVAIARAIRRARVGLKSPNRPIASFIFSGISSMGEGRVRVWVASSCRQWVGSPLGNPQERAPPCTRVTSLNTTPHDAVVPTEALPHVHELCWLDVR